MYKPQSPLLTDYTIKVQEKINMTTQVENKPKRTRKEIVDAMLVEYHQMQTIKDNLTALKAEAKEAGYPASILASVAEAMQKETLDALTEKSQTILEVIDEI